MRYLKKRHVISLATIVPLSIPWIAAQVEDNPAWMDKGIQAGELFGDAVAGVGDVDGDGYDDVLIGAPFYSNPESSEGRALLYLGSMGGLATAPAWSREGNAAGKLGSSVASAGDVNGDGRSDAIIGSPIWYNTAGVPVGKAEVFSGRLAGLSANPTWSAEGVQHAEAFGDAVASAGDVNGDGYADVVVGAPAYKVGTWEHGRAVVYLGSPSGLSQSANWSAVGENDRSRFGASVASAGDCERRRVR